MFFFVSSVFLLLMELITFLCKVTKFRSTQSALFSYHYKVNSILKMLAQCTSLRMLAEICQSKVEGNIINL